MKALAHLSSRPARVFAAAVVGSLWPARAEAHLVTTGLGPVYDGVSHVFVSPDDLVPIVAMSLVAGMNGPAAGRLALFTLPGAWLAGGLMGVLAGSSAVTGAATAASFLVLGGLAAWDRHLSPSVVCALAATVGLLHGWLNGSEIVNAGRDAMGLVGVTAATFVLVALVASFAVRAGAVAARGVAWPAVVAATGLLSSAGASRRGGRVDEPRTDLRATTPRASGTRLSLESPGIRVAETAWRQPARGC
jgi:hydrogenase/urease accessory protein HupE